ncbi:MAG: hypothetical protein A2882_01790 [Phenylobacterium sp. RIFCSPHIGHO2_01_FULL_70_10]|nr:MAG: hypothetical protein A2882_01790 [Phenylobacterium sp. RIFCSPHIGHO2_01_FULL_70_10]
MRAPTAAAVESPLLRLDPFQPELLLFQPGLLFGGGFQLGVVTEVPRVVELVRLELVPVVCDVVSVTVLLPQEPCRV